MAHPAIIPGSIAWLVIREFVQRVMIFTLSHYLCFQIILIFNDEHKSSVIRWTDPSIPVDGQYNASFRLCDNKFHRVLVKRNISIVELTVDDHSPVVDEIPLGYTLEYGTFHIGGVPGNLK